MVDGKKLGMIGRFAGKIDEGRIPSRDELIRQITEQEKEGYKERGIKIPEIPDNLLKEFKEQMEKGLFSMEEAFGERVKQTILSHIKKVESPIIKTWVASCPHCKKKIPELKLNFKPVAIEATIGEDTFQLKAMRDEKLVVYLYLQIFKALKTIGMKTVTNRSNFEKALTQVVASDYELIMLTLDRDVEWIKDKTTKEEREDLIAIMDLLNNTQEIIKDLPLSDIIFNKGE